MSVSSFLRRIIADPGLPGRRLARVAVNTLRLRPSSDPFISGDSFRRLCRHVWDETGRFDPAVLHPGDIVFCASDYFDEFCSSVLPASRGGIVMILGNSDRNFTRMPERFVGFQSTHVVYAQNLLERIPGFRALPIGLENRRWQDVGRPRDFKRPRSAVESRIFRIMWTFNVSTNPLERKAARRHLRGVNLADDLGSISPKKHRHALSQYAFVAAPPGNGLDTHRVWEALYLGAVPIVIDSEMSRALFERGLPLWIVSSYDSLVGITPAELEKKYGSLNSRFSSPYLWFGAWKEEIGRESELLGKPNGANRKSYLFEEPINQRLAPDTSTFSDSSDQ